MRNPVGRPSLQVRLLNQALQILKQARKRRKMDLLFNAQSVVPTILQTSVNGKELVAIVGWMDTKKWCAKTRKVGSPELC
jgi:hypothetical protein